ADRDPADRLVPTDRRAIELDVEEAAAAAGGGVAGVPAGLKERRMTESQTASPAIVERPCRACGNALDSILDLGRLRLSTFPALGDPPLPAAPLDLCACAACRLVQLRHTGDRAHLFAHEYWYRTGVNETMRAERADLVRTALPRIGGLWPGDVAVDVGANDGTLLQAIPP